MKNSDTIIDTRKIADLAKLSLSEEELSSLADDMEAIVAFARTVSEAGNSEKESSSFLENVFREDTVVKAYSRDELLSVAPQCEDGFFKVPRVVE
ncbi:MAG: Asp-tRNA(Asn)/Glu-tRNA(Gln) amidotransferase subunit GatC [Clostridia bacterium]|nr:Asp-tRNA(Asn)/Glu-tRNA(Gln) amidotransferase subunit GatC [Clostridia bacterium]